jgi:hypothetical protein
MAKDPKPAAPQSDAEAAVGTSNEPIVYKELPTICDELRHSIHLHLLIMNGPTQQLAVFLAKVLDFIPDPNDRQHDLVITPDVMAATEEEIKVLAFSIVEALALHIQRSVDDRAVRAQQSGNQFPMSVRQKGDEILVVVGKTRSSEDPIVAKNAVLKAMADALHALSSVTRAKYPGIRTARGVLL